MHGASRIHCMYVWNSRRPLKYISFFTLTLTRRLIQYTYIHARAQTQGRYQVHRHSRRLCAFAHMTCLGHRLYVGLLLHQQSNSLQVPALGGEDEARVAHLRADPRSRTRVTARTHTRRETQDARARVSGGVAQSQTRCWSRLDQLY